jgi:urate oxidase
MRSAEPAPAGEAREQPRLLVASLSAKWGYGSGEIAFAPYRQGVHAAIVQTFAWHDGALQQTLYEIANVIMATYQEVVTVALSLQQFPYRPSDLLELAVDGDVLFVAHNEPLDVIDITVERDHR